MVRNKNPTKDLLNKKKGKMGKNKKKFCWNQKKMKSPLRMISFLPTVFFFAFFMFNEPYQNNV
jgi:hypothetical protein